MHSTRKAGSEREMGIIPSDAARDEDGVKIDVEGRTDIMLIFFIAVVRVVVVVCVRKVCA
jgi:hypothetical protein